MVNWKRVNNMLNFSLVLTVAICGGLYWYLENHEESYKKETGKYLDRNVLDTLEFYQTFIVAQFVVFLVLYSGFWRLGSLEDQQPRILEEREESILHQ